MNNIYYFSNFTGDLVQIQTVNMKWNWRVHCSSLRDHTQSTGEFWSCPSKEAVIFFYLFNVLFDWLIFQIIAKGILCRNILIMEICRTKELCCRIQSYFMFILFIGVSNFSLENPELHVKWTGKSKVKNGKTHLYTDDLRMTFKISRYISEKN